MKYKKYLYGAYGSNLNIGQMGVRCPNAEPVGSLVLHGWELKFRGVLECLTWRKILVLIK